MTYAPDFTNLASIQTRSIAWNADNMPTQISHSSNITTQLSYGGAGERVKKRVKENGVRPTLFTEKPTLTVLFFENRILKPVQ